MVLSALEEIKANLLGVKALRAEIDYLIQFSSMYPANLHQRLFSIMSHMAVEAGVCVTLIDEYRSFLMSPNPPQVPPPPKPH